MRSKRQSQNVQSQSTWDSIIADILSRLPGARSVDEYSGDSSVPIPEGYEGQFGEFRESMDKRFRRDQAQDEYEILTGNPNLEDPLNNVNRRSRMDSMEDKELYRTHERAGHRYSDEGIPSDYDWRGVEHGDVDDLVKGLPPRPVAPVEEGIPMSRADFDAIIMAALQRGRRA